MKPLEGKTILVTRPTSADDEFTALLREAGAHVVHVPMVEIVEPESWEACDRALSHLEEYDGILFTSKNAVLKFLARVKTVVPDGERILNARAIFAVGEKTEEALEEAGIRVTAAPEIFSAQDLAETLSREQIAGRRFLFPKSDIARDVLPNALRTLGASVDEVVVYRTVAPHQADLDTVRNALAEGTVDAVTFFSPSSVRNFVQLLGHRCLQHVPVAVLGPTTEAAARNLGVTVSLRAFAATGAALVERLVEFFSTRSPS